MQEVAVTPGELLADADLIHYTMGASAKDGKGSNRRFAAALFLTNSKLRLTPFLWFKGAKRVGLLAEPPGLPAIPLRILLVGAPQDEYNGTDGERAGGAFSRYRNVLWKTAYGGSRCAGAAPRTNVLSVDLANENVRD